MLLLYAEGITMKKILSGLVFRLYKGYEIWALIALLLVASAYFNYVHVESEFGVDSLYYNELRDEEYKTYTYKDIGISAHDAYWVYQDTIPQEAFDKIRETEISISDEPAILIRALTNCFLTPAILMLIFIPVFFGRLFSDGTVKNILSCGHSKKQIYLSCLLLSFALGTVLYLLSILTLVFVCLIAGWSPLLYFPVIALTLAVNLALMFTMFAVSLAVLFITHKKTVAFIAGAVLVFMITSPVGVPFGTRVMMSHQQSVQENAGYEEYQKIIDEQGQNVISFRLDLSEYDCRVYYGDREILPLTESNLNPFLKTVFLTIAYLDPYNVPYLIMQFQFPAVLMARDGFMAINIASSLFWIVVSSGIGITVFKKREIHC